MKYSACRPMTCVVFRLARRGVAAASAVRAVLEKLNHEQGQS